MGGWVGGCFLTFGTVVVPVLPTTRHSARHTGRVPRANTSDLTQPTVGLTREAGHTPTGDHALATVTCRGGEVGGWVGGWKEMIEAVRMSYCELWGGWVGGSCEGGGKHPNG